MAGSLPRLYTDLAPWFHLLTRPDEYAEEAGIFTRAIRDLIPTAHTMLELGSGGGNNASHLKQHFDLTLVDLSPGMLAVSQRINPGIPHYQGDMRSVRLGQTFDVVFIHDAVMYLTIEEDLRLAMQTAFAHTRPGGLVLFMPDFTRETFQAGSSQGGHDGSDGFPAEYANRSLRYLEWTYDPDPEDSNYIVDFAYLLREAPDQVQCIYDRHFFGLFPRETWLRLLVETGFQPQTKPFEHSECSVVTEMFLGQKPG
jgi:hypothetical protein